MKSILLTILTPRGGKADASRVELSFPSSYSSYMMESGLELSLMPGWTLSGSYCSFFDRHLLPSPTPAPISFPFRDNQPYLNDSGQAGRVATGFNYLYPGGRVASPHTFCFSSCPARGVAILQTISVNCW